MGMDDPKEFDELQKALVENIWSVSGEEKGEL